MSVSQRSIGCICVLNVFTTHAKKKKRLRMSLLSTKVTKCPKCRRLLAKRVPITMDGDESRVVEIKHKGLKLYTFDCTIQCIACGSSFRINGEDGIVGREINSYSEER
jgi:predicted nucleic-acid-binding Zn-ribbon protein